MSGSGRTWTLAAVITFAQGTTGDMDEPRCPAAHVATLIGMGGRLVELEPSTGDTRRWAVYSRVGGTLDLVGWDESTGETLIRRAPTPTSMLAWALARDGTGRLYVGTSPDGRVLRYDPRADEFVDLGQPTSNAQIIFDLIPGPDGLLYGIAHPEGSLFSVTPDDGTFRDFGPMLPGQSIRTLASEGNWIYAGAGTRRPVVVAFDVHTGEKRELMRGDGYGFAYVDVDAQGRAFARIHGTWSELRDGRSAPRRLDEIPDRVRQRMLAPLRAVPRVEPRGSAQPTYPEAPLPIYRLGSGPAGALYVGTALPSQLFVLEADASEFRSLGVWGRGQVYAFDSVGGTLVGAAYAGPSPFVTHRPGWDELRASGAPGPGFQSRLRTSARVGNSLYFAGRTVEADPRGVLVRWSESGPADVWLDHAFGVSVDAMTALGDRLMLGVRDEEGASLITWDPTEAHVDELGPNLGEAREISGLAAADEHVFAMLDRNRVVVLSRESRIAATHPVGLLHSEARTDNSLTVTPDGNVWGLWRHGVFELDPMTGRVNSVFDTESPVTAGFARIDDAVYFASGAELFRVEMSCAGDRGGGAEGPPAIVGDVGGGCRHRPR